MKVWYHYPFSWQYLLQNYAKQNAIELQPSKQNFTDEISEGDMLEDADFYDDDAETGSTYEPTLIQVSFSST